MLQKRELFFADYNKLEYKELAKKYLKDKGVKGLIKRVTPRSWLVTIRNLAQNLKRQVKN